MAVRTKPYYPTDLHSKDIDDGWVLPSEHSFGANLVAASASVTTSAATLVDAGTQDGWGIKVESSVSETKASTSSQVDLNSASLEDLCGVPGIGPLRARRILSLREKHGQFGDVSDLSAVRGLGKKTLEQLRPHLTV